jgi:hypothetical protein
VYADGKLANTAVAPAKLTVWDIANTGAPLPFTLGSQNEANGGSGGQQASMSIGRVRVWEGTRTDAGIQALFDAGRATFWPDGDSDGLPDWYELQFPGVLDPANGSDAAQDSDTDTLTNLQEYAGGTRPDNADTDADGLRDNVETNTRTFVSATNTGTDPLDDDTDNDGLKDGVETNTNTFVNANNTGTNPFDDDTDDDAAKDGTEVLLGSNPLDANSKPGSDPIVKLEAAALPEGALEVWPNTGAMGGQFTTAPDAVPANVEVVQGVKGVTFDGVGNYYTGPAQPPAFTGDADHAIEAWILNPTIEDEECVFAWGRRGGPAGSNVSFGHGANATFGAVGHWAAHDVGWNGNLTTNAWTFIAYNYTASNNVTRVYRDGVIANTVTLPSNLITHGTDTLGNPLPMRVVAQNEDDGDPDPGRRGSLTIAKIRVYAVALADAKILENYNAEKNAFLPPTTQIATTAYDAAQGRITFTWTAIAGKTYTVEAAGVVTDPAAWAPVATGLTTGSFSEATAGTMKFYRLRVE